MELYLGIQNITHEVMKYRVRSGIRPLTRGSMELCETPAESGVEPSGNGFGVYL